MGSQKLQDLAPLPDLSLPFFSYGIFKRGFIGHFRIENYINDYFKKYQIPGLLRVRDGLPILDSSRKNSTVYGDLMYFKSSKSNSL